MTRMGNRIKLEVTDMHTGAEPVRIVTGGYPQLAGESLLERRRDAQRNHDHFRALMMREPRGHAEMYGVIPTAPCHPDAVVGVLFMHNSGYSTMCGHATIAMGRFVIDRGIVESTEGETRFILECPCGPVEVRVDVKDGRPGRVSFENVAAYLHTQNQMVTTHISGRIEVDIAYGGAYYALVDAAQMGVDLRHTPLADIRARALEITEILRRTNRIEHPTEPELGFLYGAIVTETRRVRAEDINHHLCWFANGQLDRSPTGSGVSARLAAAHARGELDIGDSARFAGISGDVFTGTISRPGQLGVHDGVHTVISGRAWYCGTAELVLESDDPIPDGYLDPARPGEIWGEESDS